MFSEREGIIHPTSTGSQNEWVYLSTRTRSKGEGMGEERRVVLQSKAYLPISSIPPYTLLPAI